MSTILPALLLLATAVPAPPAAACSEKQWVPARARFVSPTWGRVPRGALVATSARPDAARGLPLGLAGEAWEPGPRRQSWWLPDDWIGEVTLGEDELGHAVEVEIVEPEDFDAGPAPGVDVIDLALDWGRRWDCSHVVFGHPVLELSWVVEVGGAESAGWTVEHWVVQEAGESLLLARDGVLWREEVFWSDLWQEAGMDGEVCLVSTVYDPWGQPAGESDRTCVRAPPRPPCAAAAGPGGGSLAGLAVLLALGRRRGRQKWKVGSPDPRAQVESRKS